MYWYDRDSRCYRDVETHPTVYALTSFKVSQKALNEVCAQIWVPLQLLQQRLDSAEVFTGVEFVPVDLPRKLSWRYALSSSCYLVALCL